MTRLNLQDGLFLKLESPARPFHIAGLALCTPPADTLPDHINRAYRQLRDLQ